jgi:GNAT superfamily N-acetyltransferase
VEVTPDELTIHRASPADAETLYSILVECGLEMRDRLGLTHWIPAYPRDLFEKQVAKGWVFAVEKREDAEIMATFAVSREAPPYIDLSLWDGAGEPSLYLAHLAVLPSLQRIGIGRACVAAVEWLALERSRRSVRLDVVERHTELHAWYLHLDYREVCRYEALGNRMVGFEKTFDTTSRSLDTVP